MDTRGSGRSAATAAIAPIGVELVDSLGNGTVVEAEFRYLAEDPYAVSIALPTRSADVVWCFGRELLTQGAYDPTGDGDVHVWPSLSSTGLAVTLVELRGSDGSGCVHLEVPTRGLLQFLDAACEVVAPGHESAHLDLDGLVGQLLDTAG